MEEGDAERLLGEVSERSKHIRHGLEKVTTDQASIREDVTKNARDIEHLTRDEYATIRSVAAAVYDLREREKGVTARDWLMILLTVANIAIVLLARIG